MNGEVFSSGTFLIIATVCAALSGLPLTLPFVPAARGQLAAVILMLIASAVGMSAAISVLVNGSGELFVTPWSLPFGSCVFGVDALSAWFLIPIFLITGCAALYARQYWHADLYPTNVREMTLFFGLMTSGMIGVVLARDSISFLFAWEIMALAAYFLVSTEDEKKEVNAAGRLYMITTHIGTLGLFALFPLLNLYSGSWLFPEPGSLNGASPLATALFLTALFGFGMKAGIMPLHIWLPSAHANAPSHVSATMSGVILKIGIYGLVRTLSFFHSIPLWWGCCILVLGAVSGLVGVAFAIGQHDLKRLLAYHSIENIGIIFMGIGVALIGLSSGSSAMMLLGMTGALLHVLNHAIFKALLFFSAGSIIHACGTREIELLGGVGRRLPYTTLLFGIGAVAICGLPPLNGFVGELLIYLGFFRGVQGTGISAAVTALAAPTLAMVGGLAIACFVKLFGIVFLGLPRSEEQAGGHEAGWQMLLPMTLLGLLCIAIGLAPGFLGTTLQRVSQATLPAINPGEGESLRALAPLELLPAMGGLLLALLVLLFLWYRYRLTKAPVAGTVTWGCGYQRPRTRMQYSASSFGRMLTSLFSFILKPRLHKPHITGIFPRETAFHSHVPESMLELIYIPALERLYARAVPIRKLQNGVLQQYVLYMLVTLIVLLLSDYL